MQRDFSVVVTRHVVYRAIFNVEAESEDEAKKIAEKRMSTEDLMELDSDPSDPAGDHYEIEEEGYYDG